MQPEDRGYAVELARNGKEAIDFFKMQVPDLVTLDVVMPRKPGYEVFEWIGNQPNTCHLPVIILSAYPISDREDKLLPGGSKDTWNDQRID